jgi:hypothetical protein
MTALGTRYLRSCSACAAHILTTDPTSSHVYCPDCKAQRPTGEQWCAALTPGDRCYVQPTAAWHGLSRSEHVIVARDGNTVTVQIIGLPESRRPVAVTDLCPHDVTPRTGAWAL